MIQNEIICDSIGTNSPRLVTMKAISPTMIHQETLRHRKIYIHDALLSDPDFSFSVSSTRAIPFQKTLIDVATRPAKPVKWGAEQKGMVPGDELTEPFICPDGQMRTPDAAWEEIAHICAEWAKAFSDAGHHKSNCNRIISNYNHTHCLMTATETGWMNYFGLRLDKAADPTIQALAELQWKHWNEHQPKKLEPGEWHLPFIQDLDWEECPDKFGSSVKEVENILIKVSIARCARLSYNSFETNRRSTIEEDLKLYDRLITSKPIHASPAEHQATPTNWTHEAHLGGNLGPGWIQYRKTLPGESLAPLPAEYQ